MVVGFTKDIDLKGIEKFISYGMFNKEENGLSTKTLEEFSKLEDTNLARLFNTNLTDVAFSNSNKIQVTAKSVVSLNPSVNSAKVKFEVLMDKDAKPTEKNEVIVELYGFKIDQETKAPKTLKEVSITGKEATTFTDDGLINPTILTPNKIITTDLSINVTSSNSENKFIELTLPTTFGTTFKDNDTNFTSNANVEWSIKNDDSKKTKFTLKNNVITNNIGLIRILDITLIATITEKDKVSQIVEINLTYNLGK